MKRDFNINDLRNSKVAGINPHLFGTKEQETGAKAGKSGTKRDKYGSSKVEIDGLLFDSKKEAKRYGELKLLLKAGKIGMLEHHVKYVLIEKIGKERECVYEADFQYIDSETGEKVVEDVKSPATRKVERYIIKRKLMLKVHNIKIKEV